eukprot:TRINITY_DN291_c0_g1_i1.p1 TRINITY_DN291_c0_g1~~TRINITY_DN291_c0_g1_i1.p1  ORF type:complete len:127 (+),score=16.20 TRINITY_DN291_c0_g1_i1:27-407(+)
MQVTLDGLRRSGGSQTCILDVSSGIVGSKLVLGDLRASLRNTQHLTITGEGVGSITEIGDDFLFGCTTLVTIDIKKLNNIDRIGNRFLACCGALTSIDLSQLNEVTQIGNEFLDSCKSLTSIKLYV